MICRYIGEDIDCINRSQIQSKVGELNNGSIVDIEIINISGVSVVNKEACINMNYPDIESFMKEWVFVGDSKKDGITDFIRDYIKDHSLKDVIESGIIYVETERKIKSLDDLVVQFCERTECEYCPVHIHGYEKRTKYEKEREHEMCCTNLYKWVLEEAKKEMEENKDGI